MWFVVVVSLLVGTWIVAVEDTKDACEQRMVQLQWVMPERALLCVTDRDFFSGDVDERLGLR